MIAALFVAFTALAHFFPRSGDDWAWGSKVGINRLDTFFRNYNGRYSGDFAILALTRIHLLAPLTIGAVVALTIFLILNLTNNRTLLGYAVTIVLLLCMPQGVFRQSIVWLSGFSNYALGTFCILVYFAVIRRDWTGTLPRRAYPLSLAAMFVFGVIAALFMENVTIYLVVVSIVYVVYYRTRKKSFSLVGLVWATSFLVGAAFMFSNGAYRAAAGSKPIYQQLHTHVNRPEFNTFVAKTFDAIGKLAFAQNTVLNILLVGMICALVALSTDRISRLWAVLIVVLAVASLVISSGLRIAEEYVLTSSPIRSLGGVSGALLLVALVMVTAVTIKNSGRRLRMYGLVASLLLLIAPLTIVDPVGPRCFFVTYIFFLLIVNVLARELASRRGVRAPQWLVPVAAAAALVLLSSYFVVYAIVHNAASNRLAYIRQEVRHGHRSVTVDALPFVGYVHVGDPVGPLWSARYKLFYHLPRSLKIHVRVSKYITPINPSIFGLGETRVGQPHRPLR